MAKTKKKNNIIYKYRIELSYQFDGKETKINFKNLSNVVIRRDYINTHRPAIYLILSLDRKLIDDMVKNIGKKHITFTLEKIAINPEDIEKPEKIKKLPKIKVIKKQFIYIMPSSHINKNKEIEYGGDNKDRKDIFVPITIGLIDPDTIKQNHVNFKYRRYSNTRVTDIIVHNYAHVKNLLLQPIEFNSIVTHTDGSNTLTKFTNELFKRYPFYKTGYRFFFDFNRAYLVSNNGALVKAKNDRIHTVIFNIRNPEEAESKVRGLEVNSGNNYYIEMDINDVHPIDTEQLQDRANEVKKIALNGIGSHSVKRKIDLLHITKDGLDTEEFTINKEFFVDHYNRLDNRRGRFILLSKKDIYRQTGEFFELSTTLTFKFIKYE